MPKLYGKSDILPSILLYQPSNLQFFCLLTSHSEAYLIRLSSGRETYEKKLLQKITNSKLGLVYMLLENCLNSITCFFKSNALWFYYMWGYDYKKDVLTYCALLTQYVVLCIYEIHWVCGKTLFYFLPKEKIDHFCAISSRVWQPYSVSMVWCFSWYLHSQDFSYLYSLFC